VNTAYSMMCEEKGEIFQKNIYVDTLQHLIIFLDTENILERMRALHQRDVP
jgi:hypothetical protein